MVKAVHAVCNCMVGTGEGAVGTIDHRTVAEYKSSAGPDMYHLVVFDSGSGNIMASIYDNNTETIENYKLHQSSQDGAAVMMAMMPLISCVIRRRNHSKPLYSQVGSRHMPHCPPVDMTERNYFLCL